MGAASLLAEPESTAEQDEAEARRTCLGVRAGRRTGVENSQTRRVRAVPADQGLHRERLKVQSAQGSVGLATTQRGCAVSHGHSCPAALLTSYHLQP